MELLGVVAPAAAAGLVVTAVHAPLGIEVLKRGIVFIDLATAQVVGLAVVALGLWLHEPSWWLRQAAAFAVAVAAALFFREVERRLPDEQEAVIGSGFILAAAAALLLLADSPHGGDELRHVLSGQILFVSWKDLAVFLPVYAAVAALWFTRAGVRRGAGFFVLLALAVTASVQLVGIYVVFASLVLPALAARCDGGGGKDGSKKHYILGRAYASGAVAVVAAIAISTAADLPAGPVLVVCFGVSAPTTRLIARLVSSRAAQAAP